MDGIPKIKLSQDVVKITIPGRKKCFRLYGKAGYCILDLMTLGDEPDPEPNMEILCRHPFEVCGFDCGYHKHIESLLRVFDIARQLII